MCATAARCGGAQRGVSISRTVLRGAPRTRRLVAPSCGPRTPDADTSWRLPDFASRYSWVCDRKA